MTVHFIIATEIFYYRNLFFQICAGLGGKLFEPRSQADVDWLLDTFDNDFYIGVIWSDNKWVYASDNAELVSGIANWKKGKDTGKSNETCVKLKYKGMVRSTEVIRGHCEAVTLGVYRLLSSQLI